MALASRADLLKVTGLGAKTFEQSAGFLRIRGGDNPLDMTGVHPETYPVVEKIMAHTGKPVAELMGRADMLKTLKPELFANEKFGVITVKDILAELEKPGRDPRPDFKVARFNDGVEDIKDLKEGMMLEGTVSNVAAFGAFVDLGVHQDGLVHVSQLSHKFVNDAREVVKTGDIVKVQVMEVDVARKRIALTMKLGDAPARRDGPRDNRFNKTTIQDVPNAEVFDLDIFFHAVVRAFAAQARLLDAAERHVLGGQNADVDAHHAVLQRFGHAEDAAHVAAVEVAGQAKLGVVGGVNRFLFGLEAEHRRQRAKGFFFGAQHVGGGIGHHRGLEELARQALAADQHLAAFGHGVGHMALHFFERGFLDQRALVDAFLKAVADLGGLDLGGKLG